MEFVDYYTVLGVDPESNREGLRQAYRDAARRFHPDVNKSAGAAFVFRRINEAYEYLSDERQRAEYDRIWRDHTSIGSQQMAIDVLYSRQHIQPLSESQLLYVLLKIHTVQEMSLSSDAPLNLALVVDRSTSMKGGRLQHVKNAVHRIIDETDQEDILSVITFSDRAELLIPAQHVSDPRGLKSSVSMIRADGATAMYSGLQLAMAQIERFYHSRFVNHIVLITDGRTYGDEDDCLRLADEAREKGIGISGMGIGEDWNDRFLDALATHTGGSSAYVSTSEGVSSFLHNRVRSLSTAFAERTRLAIAPTADVNLESVVRITPDPITLEAENQPIPLGTLDAQADTRLILQFHVDVSNADPGESYIGRVDLSSEVLGSGHKRERMVEDLVLNVTDEEIEEEPPPELLDALSRLALYRLQDRAREAMEEGDVAEATRKLEYLATRLFESGAEGLGQSALHEARTVARTQQLSEEGIKELKYGTRALFSLLGDDNG